MSKELAAVGSEISTALVDILAWLESHAAAREKREVASDALLIESNTTLTDIAAAIEKNGAAPPPAAPVAALSAPAPIEVNVSPTPITIKSEPVIQQAPSGTKWRVEIENDGLGRMKAFTITKL